MSDKQRPEYIPTKVRWAAGLIGSTFSSFLCSPMDLIKVRLQVSVSTWIIIF